MLTAHGTVTIRPKEVVPVYREEWDGTVTDYKYDFVNRDFVSRGGNLYQVKIQRPGQFVPAGIDPASVEGQEYWQMFNKLAPSVTNFLVIVDEDGKPRTLLSGGRIQTKFLNIGSLKMSETRLWGGAELFTGKGLALVNDPGDRRFVVYNDANNYVEMFQREDEWGFKGVDGDPDNPIFSLGRKYINGEWKDNNKIGGMIISSNGIQSTNFDPVTMVGSCFAKDGMSVYASGSGILSLSTGLLQASRITAIGSNAGIVGLEIIAHNIDAYGYLSQVTALKLSAKNNYSAPLYPPIALDITGGDLKIDGSIKFAETWRNIEMKNYSYLVGGCGYVPGALKWTGATNTWLTPEDTVVLVNNGTTHFNIFLPDARDIRPGHTVVFIPWQSSGSHGIIASPDNSIVVKVLYKGSLYNWISVDSKSGGRTATVYVTFIGKSGTSYIWTAGTMAQDGINYGN